uniref:CNNM transmembrane domain-containing protein n=1 Tax=Physcomitrium patens TaxID=3218 RepID=A0A7I4CNL2_PHYPA
MVFLHDLGIFVQALPIFLDKMFNEWVAVILSVTFVLAFGEVMPQAICSRYGLAVGANMVWLVNIMMVICWPIAYPIGRLLDYVLGHDESALFRRAQLKALVSIHGMDAGGYLTLDETTIIAGALDLTGKTALQAMTPIESTFSLDVNSNLDWETLGKIMARGHSRVPVYSGGPQNIVGLLLVKNLLTVRAEDNTPVSAVSIRRIPKVPEDMPLYDILNEFQKGGSHMAAVVAVKPRKRKFTKRASFGHHREDRKGVKEYQSAETDIERADEKAHAHSNGEEPSTPTSDCDCNGDAGEKHRHDVEDGDVIGIITMEDVIEELLQEEIVDETDEYIDVHKRIRVAAAAAQLSKCGSVGRRASVPNIQMGLSKQAQDAVQKGRVDAMSHMHADRHGHHTKKVTDKGLHEPLLGSSLVRSPDFSRSA